MTAAWQRLVVPRRSHGVLELQAADDPRPVLKKAGLEPVFSTLSEAIERVVELAPLRATPKARAALADLLLEAGFGLAVEAAVRGAARVESGTSLAGAYAPVDWDQPLFDRLRTRLTACAQAEYEKARSTVEQCLGSRRALARALFLFPERTEWWPTSGGDWKEMRYYLGAVSSPDKARELLRSANYYTFKSGYKIFGWIRARWTDGAFGAASSF